MKRLLILVIMSGCAAVHAIKSPEREVPTWSHVVDMTAFSAGCIVGLDAQYGYPRDNRQMAIGYGVALAFWLPYWFVRMR